MCLRDVLELCGKGQSVGIVTDADARQVLANAKSLLTMLSDTVLQLPVEEIGAGDEFIRIFVRTKGGLNMTRDEMESLLTDFCKSKIGCESCPMEDYENCDMDELSDAELERVVGVIRSIMESEKRCHKKIFDVDGTVYTQDPDKQGWTGHPTHECDNVNYHAPEYDSVNHPAHYELPGGLECFDVIVATQGVEAAQHFAIGNAIKYLFRQKRKNGLEDVEKARWYLDKYIELSEQKEV